MKWSPPLEKIKSDVFIRCLCPQPLPVISLHPTTILHPSDDLPTQMPPFRSHAFTYSSPNRWTLDAQVCLRFRSPWPPDFDLASPVGGVIRKLARVVTLNCRKLLKSRFLRVFIELLCKWPCHREYNPPYPRLCASTTSQLPSIHHLPVHCALWVPTRARVAFNPPHRCLNPRPRPHLGQRFNECNFDRRNRFYPRKMDKLQLKLPCRSRRNRWTPSRPHQISWVSNL